MPMSETYELKLVASLCQAYRGHDLYGLIPMLHYCPHSWHSKFLGPSSHGWTSLRYFHLRQEQPQNSFHPLKLLEIH